MVLGHNGPGNHHHGRGVRNGIQKRHEAAYRQAAASVTEKITAKLAQVG
jgi:hypothetical protein